MYLYIHAYYICVCMYVILRCHGEKLCFCATFAHYSNAPTTISRATNSPPNNIPTVTPCRHAMANACNSPNTLATFINFM